MPPKGYRKSPQVIGGATVVSGDDLQVPQEQIDDAASQQLSDFQYSTDLEAQKADGMTRIEDKLAQSAEFADLANEGRPVLIGDDIAETTAGEGAGAAEGEAMEDGQHFDSYVTQGSDRAPGEGMPFDNYNTVSGAVNDGYDIATSAPLQSTTVNPFGLFPYELKASKGRFQEHGTNNRWSLSSDCGLEVRCMYSDSYNPKRHQVVVHTRHGEKIAYIAPNEFTAHAYLEDLDGLITEL